MAERFEYSGNFLQLFNGILLCLAGLFSLPSWHGYLALFAGILAFLRYWSFLSRGYVTFFQGSICINTASLRGVKKVRFQDIKNISFKKRNYVLTLQDNRKVRILKWNLEKQSRPEFEVILNSIK